MCLVRWGRQVIELKLNPQRRSSFEDIKSSVGEISRTMTTLGRSIYRNGRPHLVGPESLLSVDDAGNLILDKDGQYLGLQPGDPPPEYLQWDSGLEAVGEDIRMHTENVFAMTGLSQVLFEPDGTLGQASGVALRRLLIPFVSKVNRLKEINSAAIEDVMAMINRNRSSDVFDFDPRRMNITYPFDTLFADEIIDDDQEPSDEQQEPEA